jgi:hypothetical protein
MSEDNINKRNLYMKKYMKNCEHLKCVCGGIFKSYSKHIHNKGKRHLNFIKDNPEVIIKCNKLSILE